MLTQAVHLWAYFISFVISLLFYSNSLGSSDYNEFIFTIDIIIRTIAITTKTKDPARMPIVIFLSLYLLFIWLVI